MLPHKVQALVYAQAARRLLGLEVVGALYVSYGRDGRVAGAFDRTFVGAADVPGIDAELAGAGAGRRGRGRRVVRRVGGPGGGGHRPGGPQHGGGAGVARPARR